MTEDEYKSATANEQTSSASQQTEIPAMKAWMKIFHLVKLPTHCHRQLHNIITRPCFLLIETAIDRCAATKLYITTTLYQHLTKDHILNCENNIDHIIMSEGVLTGNVHIIALASENKANA